MPRTAYKSIALWLLLSWDLEHINTEYGRSRTARRASLVRFADTLRGQHKRIPSVFA